MISFLILTSLAALCWGLGVVCGRRDREIAHWQVVAMMCVASGDMEEAHAAFDMIKELQKLPPWRTN